MFEMIGWKDEVQRLATYTPPKGNKEATSAQLYVYLNLNKINNYWHGSYPS